MKNMHYWYLTFFFGCLSIFADTYQLINYATDEIDGELVFAGFAGDVSYFFTLVGAGSLGPTSSFYNSTFCLEKINIEGRTFFMQENNQPFCSKDQVTIIEIRGQKKGNLSVLVHRAESAVVLPLQR